MRPPEQPNGKRVDYPPPGTVFPPLTLRHKRFGRGGWTGVGLVVGVVLAVAVWSPYAPLRQWGTRVRDRAWMTIGGNTYVPPDRPLAFPSASLELHERIHAWQRSTVGKWRFRWRYLTSDVWRALYESQAYGAEAAARTRPAQFAAASMASLGYGWDMTADHALTWVTDAQADWLLAGWLPDDFLTTALLPPDPAP